MDSNDFSVQLQKLIIYLVFLTPYQAQLLSICILHQKALSLLTSLTIFLIGWVSRFYVLQRIPPWALPSLLQSVVFDFLSNTAGGAVACTSIVLNAFGDFSPEGLLNMVFKPLYWVVSLFNHGTRRHVWIFLIPPVYHRSTRAANICQAHPTSSASPVPPPGLISVAPSPRISLLLHLLRDVFLSHRNLWLLSTSFPRTSAEGSGLPARDVR